MSKAVSGHRPESAQGRPRARTLAAQRALDFSNRLLQSLSSAQLDFAREGDLRSVFDGLLGMLLDLTQSEYGVIGEGLRTPEGTTTLRPHALAHIAWREVPRESPVPVPLEDLDGSEERRV